MIQVLRFIYTIYTALIFFLLLLITMPFFFLFSLILGDRALGIFMLLCRFIAWGLCVFCGIIYKIHKNNNVDRSKTYVIIANHRSNMDAPVAAVSCWGRVRYLAKKELLKIPVLGQLFSVTTVNVDRTSKESRKNSMLMLMEYLKKGDHIFIFPEGTRNKTTDQALIDFKDGAFAIAIQTQTPILPMIYVNSDKIMPNKPVLLRPGVIHVYHLDPVDVTKYTEDDVKKLKDEMRDHMMASYRKLKADHTKK